MNRKHMIGLASAAALSYSIIPTYGYKLWNAFRKPKSSNTLYLTFDDGPDPRYTTELLDLLAQHHIKASFFVVAQFAQQNPAIISRMQREGHLIGLHSLCHKNGMIQPPISAYRDFAQAVDCMRRLGVPVRYFRPPWGHWNVLSATQLRRYHMKPMLWNVMAEDWEGDTTVAAITDKLLSRTSDGNIICLHDGRGHNKAPARTIAALRNVLPHWLSCGYRFETVDHYDE